MALTDTLLIDGVDLRSISGLFIEDLSGLASPMRRRGSNLVLPGRPGVIGVPKVWEAYSFDVPVTVLAESGTMDARRTAFLTALTALAGLFGDGLFTMTRRYTGKADTFAQGEYVDGLAMALLRPETGRTALQFLNLDGVWRTAGGTEVLP